MQQIEHQIDIIFEDRWLLVVNKPSGLPTQPTPNPKQSSLYSLLLTSKKWPYIGLHHRLDVPTSGIVLLSKNRDANKGISELFQGRSLEKNYLCLVNSVPTDDFFECQKLLKPLKLKTGKTKMVVTYSGGDHAHTKFATLKRFANHALVRATPLTGRMHQIRAHLAELKHPILGDSLYFRADRHFPRLMLHAAELKLIHPITKKPLTLNAPLPDDFQRVLAKI